MDESRKYLSLAESNVAPPSTLESHGTPSEQYVTATPQTLAVGVARETEISSFTFEYHWTVRCKLVEMTSRKASILLKVLVIQLLNHGIDFTGYLATEYLVSYILKGKTSALEIVDEKDRQACLLGVLILAATRGEWLNLGERIQFSTALKQEIIETGWLPDSRTYQSWRQYWEPRRFLEILTVPLETLSVKERIGVPYDSYCKGYGNGGHVSRTQSTPYDPEIDGEQTERSQPAFSLTEINRYAHILFLIEKERVERMQNS